LGDTSPGAGASARHPYSTRKTHKKKIPSSPLTQRKVRTYTIDSDVEEKRIAERKQHYQTITRHIRHEDLPNAYGWSIPSVKASVQNMSIPVPVNCMPLFERIPSLKVTTYKNRHYN
jgi:hypothetical protein